MRRREFIAGLGAAAWPVVARAQPAMPVIGFLRSASFADATPFVAAFRHGLSDVGYFDGQNVTIEFRSAEGQSEQLPVVAAELIGRPIAVFVTDTRATLAAKAATKTIPIVFVTGDDPVAQGFVPSLNRPGGNVTGVSFLTSELTAKALEVLRELLPKARTIALLVDTNNPASVAGLRIAQATANQFGQNLVIRNATTASDIELGFSAIAVPPPDALIAVGGAFFLSQRGHIAKLAAQYALPAIYTSSEYVAAGGLISYGSSISDGYRQAGTLAGKVLKGAKTKDLPVQQAVKVELAVNLKTAKALGLTVPATLLARADEVIE